MLKGNVLRAAAAAATACACFSFGSGALAQTPAADRGGEGESCQARSDCQEGLKCIQNTCRKDAPPADAAGGAQAGTGSGGESDAGASDTAAAGANGGASSGATSGASSDAGGDASSGEGILDRELEGMRAHVGIIFGGGPAHLDDPADQVVGNLLFSFKGGLLLDRAEFGLEFAPATYVTSFNPDFPSVHLIAYGGYHIPVYKSISWPLRLGIGFTTPTFRGEAGDTVLALRADLIGVSALLADQVLLDVHLPSWRINIDPDRSAAFFSYILGVGVAWTPKL